MEDMEARFEQHFIVGGMLRGEIVFGCLGIVFQWTRRAQPEEAGGISLLGPKQLEVSRKEGKSCSVSLTPVNQC